MGGRDQSQVKIKFKKFKKVKSVPKDVPKSHNDDTLGILLYQRGSGLASLHDHFVGVHGERFEIGRASCRERVLVAV